MNEYIRLLSPLLGGRVKRLGLLVWPDPDGLHETDVRLHLEVARRDGRPHEVTCFTHPDGQTPGVERELCQSGKPLSTLEQMRGVWGRHGGSGKYELFETAEEQSLGVGVGATLTGVSLIRFVDGENEPTGLVFEFDGARRVWSGPSSRGNLVSVKRDDFDWPADIRLDRIARM